MRIKKQSGVKIWLLLLALLVQDGRCIKWLGLGRAGDTHTWTREACTSAKGAGLLERKQARACRATPDVMPSLVQAAKDTSTVCQQAFRHRRWNCSSIERAPDYTPELLTGTREQAFVYAMSAAAAVWRLARGCALGSLAACSCATPPRREPPSPSALISPSSFTTMSVSFDTLSARNSFKWGGCGDDVRSASRMAKRFLQGASPPGTGAIAKFMHAVNMHNNRAGRRAVEQSLTLECKCHGVSGSCSVRTCWRGLGASGPSAAGSRLLRRYATAAEVRPRSGGRLPPLYHHDNLLYTTKSPDYCLPDKRRGSLGTIGSTIQEPQIWQNITMLILRKSNLRSIPKELGTLPHLKQLNLSQNYLGFFESYNWEWISQKEIRNNLIALNLSKNMLKELPGQIGQMKSMKTLDVHKNGLIEISPKIGNLKNLKYFDLSHNHLEYLPWTIQKLCVQLEFFNFSNNKLRTLFGPRNKEMELNLPTLVEMTAHCVIKHRQCNGSSSGYEGCEYLCCGRGHVTRTEEILERCDCKYISCCYVKCKTCRRIVKTYECN